MSLKEAVENEKVEREVFKYSFKLILQTFFHFTSVFIVKLSTHTDLNCRQIKKLKTFHFLHAEMCLCKHAV